MSPWVWVVIIVVVLVVIGLIASRSRAKRLDDRREEAASLRGAAEEHRATVQQHEMSASTSEAEARLARDEAEVKAAHAREREAQAARDREKRDEALATHEEHLRRADALDPDVKTDDEGYRLDDEGRRIEERSGHEAGVGAGAADGELGDAREGTEYASGDRGRAGTAGDTDLVRDARTGEPLDDAGYSTEHRIDDDTRDYTGSHRAEPETDVRPDERVDERVDESDTGENREAERPGWQERARDRADDAIGRRDTDTHPGTDPEGRRG